MTALHTGRVHFVLVACWRKSLDPLSGVVGRETDLDVTIEHFTSHHTTSHFFEPIYIPRALNTGTCIQQGDLFYSACLHRNHVLATANTGEIESFGKNAGEWTGRVEISEEESPGSKCSM